MQKLTEMIDGLVTEKTFSLEGVKAIEALRVRAEQIQREFESKAERVKELDRDLEKERAVATSRAAEIEILKGREATIAMREKAMTVLETKAAVEEAKATTVKECFGLVFRNAVVSETAMRNVPLVQPSGSGSSFVSSHSESETRTRTTG